MKVILAVCAALLAAGCATFDGRGLVAGQATAADVEQAMGAPAERRQVAGETWLYYPRQPFGRQVYVARIGADGRLAAIEPRLTDATVAHIVPNATRAEEVRDLLGPPYNATAFPRMERTAWTWHMRRFGDPGMPAALTVQVSPDGVVREVFYIDETDRDRFFSGFGLGLRFGG